MEQFGVMSSEFGELKMNNEKFDFENLKENLVGVALRGHPSRKPTEGLPYIAEGSGGSKVEFNRFLKISRRSIRECIAITEIAYRQKFISEETKQQSRSFCSELSKMVTGLIKSLKNNR